MRIVIVGGGFAGLTLARLIAARGLEPPVVLERQPPGAWMPRPFILAYHGFEALRQAGALEEIAALGWEIAPRPEGPVGIAVNFVRALEVVAEGVPVRHGVEVVGLVEEGDRVTGVRLREGEGPEQELEADLVVACDGVRSPVRGMAGLEAELMPAEGAHISFMSPAVIDRSFAMAYQSDGRQVGLIGWPDGSAGWWDIERIGREAALAPGLEAFRRSFARLLAPAEPALAALTSMDQVIYREITEVRCPAWWRPGVVVIGDAAHFLGPEAGIGAGLGLGDALALAEAIAANPEDADAACRHYDHWHGPAVRPYEAIGAAGGRMVPAGSSGERPVAERWPPVD